MEKFASKNGVSLRAYKGDAMTLLAFDLIASLTENLAGFTVRYKFKVDGKWQHPYMYNRLKFPDAFFEANPSIPVEERNSTLYSPIQKFNWVHVPNTNIHTEEPVFGNYTYEITPRYLVAGILQPLDNHLTVKVNIPVGPFESKKTKIGFTRGFISSVAYARRFDANNNHVRPAGNQNELLFDITGQAGTAKRWNDAAKKYQSVPYSFEEQHKWLGWQARQRVLDFLDEVISDSASSLKVFAYDLDEPEICKRLLQLAREKRLKMTLDNSGDHGKTTSFESDFAKKFNENDSNTNDLQRGHFLSLAHCKIFIQLRNSTPVKVLTGSANFSTNGLYVNSNHVIIFDNEKIAQVYNEIFDNTFGPGPMKAYKTSQYSTSEYALTETSTEPDVTVTFAPHPKAAAQKIFDRISQRILKSGNTDLLFAIMKDTSKSSILDAIRTQVKNENIFTYGITDTISKNADYSVFLYKPNSLRGIRVAAKGIQNLLPKPFGKVPKIQGIAIHHKFVVVNFKGPDPVVYCGSSNLAFGPEQSNGDNLLEIRDRDIVTAFAIQALALVDHFHWRNFELKVSEMHLDDLTKPSKLWYKPWFDPKDLKNRQRKLYIRQ